MEGALKKLDKQLSISDLEKERTTVNRFHSNDLSLERLEKSQEQIQELKSTITQLKQEKFTEHDQLREMQEHSNQLDLENPHKKTPNSECAKIFR